MEVHCLKIGRVGILQTLARLSGYLRYCRLCMVQPVSQVWPLVYLCVSRVGPKLQSYSLVTIHTEICLMVQSKCKKEQLYVKSCSALVLCAKYVGLEHTRESAHPVDEWHKIAICLSSLAEHSTSVVFHTAPMASVKTGAISELWTPAKRPSCSQPEKNKQGTTPTSSEEITRPEVSAEVQTVHK